jgi:hypothetical protein
MRYAIKQAAEPFRLPGGFLALLYEFSMSGMDHWTAFALANAIEELHGF